MMAVVSDCAFFNQSKAIKNLPLSRFACTVQPLLICFEKKRILSLTCRRRTASVNWFPATLVLYCNVRYYSFVRIGEVDLFNLGSYWCVQGKKPRTNTRLKNAYHTKSYLDHTCIIRVRVLYRQYLYGVQTVLVAYCRLQV
jgi:hypothetical protein